MNKIISLFLIFTFPLISFAQIGGNQTYKFLELTNSARAASLGGTIISIEDADLALTFHNPALLNNKMAESFVLNYVNYFADINYGYVAYAKNFNKIGTIALGLNYINYGTFTEANEYGEKIGKFKAAEYQLNITWSKKIDSLFTYGFSLKPISSNLETYSSLGLALDAGITYNKARKGFMAALVIKNLGTQITTYTQDNREPLPFEMQLGVSKKLAHAPFRFSFLYRHIENWNLRFESPLTANQVNLFNDEVKTKSDLSKFSDNLFRHMVFGVEFIPFKSFYFNLGYNHQRRKELSLEQVGAMTGFSWGFGLNLKRINIGFARATYHVAGASSHFSFSTNLSNFYRTSSEKKTKKK